MEVDCSLFIEDFLTLPVLVDNAGVCHQCKKQVGGHPRKPQQGLI
jgi:hypothetical protein